MPSRLQVLRGRRGNPHEPQPPPVTTAADQPPDLLANDPVARQEWIRLIPMLRSCGILTEVDVNLLTGAVCAWSRFVDAQAKIMATGAVVRGPHDMPMQNPYLSIAEKSLNTYRRLSVELGLSPASRARMTAAPQASPATARWQRLL